MAKGVNLEAEMDFISVLLCSEESILDHAEKVRSDLFFDPFNRKVIKKIRELILEEVPVTVSTITSNETEQKILNSIKTRARHSENFTHFYSILEECFIARELKLSAENLVSTLSDDTYESSALSLLNTLKMQIDNLENTRVSTLYTATEMVDGILDRYMEIYECAKAGEPFEDKSIIQTPFPGLNKMLSRGGMKGGDIVIVAAPTSMGKTELALNIGGNAAIKDNKNVFVYSLEMSKERLLERIVLSESGVNSLKLDTGNLDNEDVLRLKTAARNIKGSNLIFEENLSGNIFDVVTSIRKAHNKHKIDLVIIDYIQLMNSSGNFSNRNDELSTISRVLKKEATKLGIPFIVLSQLSRRHQIEGREPELRDLRDSGAIEQDADSVIFLYATVSESRKIDRTKTKGLLRKQREGPTGEFFLMNDKYIQTFTEITETEYKKGIRRQDEEPEFEVIAETNNAQEDDEHLPF